MEYGYFVDGARKHNDLFLEIQKEKIAEDNVFVDEGCSRRELHNLLKIVQAEDVLYLQSVAELAEGADEILKILDYLQNKGVYLITCEEEFLIGDEYAALFKQCMELMSKFESRTKSEHYREALSAGKVGRPKKDKERDKIISMQEEGLSVGQICRALKISKSTFYRIKSGG